MKAALTALALCVAAATLGAQGGTGSITGTVRDATGAPLTAAPVVAKAGNATVYSATTDNAGRYTLAKLPPGKYEVSVPPFGFSTDPFSQSDLVVEAGRATTLDIRLVQGNLATVGDDAAFLAIRRDSLALKGPAPRLRDGKPDLSGVWLANLDPNPPTPALLPWAEKVHKERLATEFKDLPSGFCLPDDPASLNPLLYRLVQTPSVVVLISEFEPKWRQIFMDGRAHPKDLDPTWMGHSTGRWEKDTLVVDTVGLNDKTWLTVLGYPHTEQLRIVERFRRVDRARMTHEVTFEDPGAFAKPFTVRAEWLFAPKDEVSEYMCNENNKFLENLGVKP
jgi:hypothetical protein